MKNNFKIRCSQIGQIMTDPRSKTDILSKTTQTYCQEWAIEQIYGIKKEIRSKYFDKGNAVENDSIEYIINRLNLPVDLAKNTESFVDDYMTGTPDLILPDEIIDLKNPWDPFTFPLFEADLPEKNYYWQMQGYMALTGRKKARVIYTLMNTPKYLVDREVWGMSEDEEERVRGYHNFDLIPDKFRVKEFTVYRSDEDIDKIRARVLECRNYLTSL